MTAAARRKDFLTALARTLVPVIAGFILTAALKVGVDLHGYTLEIQAALTYGYFAAVHYLERYVNPTFGRLLGVAKPPTYNGSHLSSSVGTATITVKPDLSGFLAAVAEGLQDAAQEMFDAHRCNVAELEEKVGQHAAKMAVAPKKRTPRKR